jgi:membrane-bound ClpP family serine protease
MKHRDYQDIAGGLLLAALGVSVALYSNQYDMGTPARMGPGFFPRILGWMLAVLGVLIALPAFFRSGPPVKVQWGNALFVLGAIVVFAALLRPAGILLATFVAAFVSTLADKQITWPGRVYVSAGVAAVTYGIFIFGLDMRLPIWPAFIGS